MIIIEIGTPTVHGEIAPVSIRRKNRKLRVPENFYEEDEEAAEEQPEIKHVHVEVHRDTPNKEIDVVFDKIEADM